ncbi:MAG TPA: hypothetical protein VHZ32_04555 [Rhizomicrobium sp.]|nr:hypothetical protein [Rhizomicrobium sp.]
MQEYEIRLVNGVESSSINTATHLSDFAAVRSARKFAGGRPFEVWRDKICVYAGMHLQPATSP